MLPLIEDNRFYQTFPILEKTTIFALSEMTTRKFPWRTGTTDNQFIIDLQEVYYFFIRREREMKYILLYLSYVIEKG